MDRRKFLHTFGGTLAAGPFISRAEEMPREALPEKLEAIRAKYKVPALGAARFGVDGLIRQTVTGLRRAGKPEPVTEQDVWHYGSMTKAMTASLLATYVQEGRLQWADPLGKLIPGACRNAHPGVKEITVLQLLQHRSGLPANLDSWWLLPRADQREQLPAMAAPPEFKLSAPGGFLYSNVGYAIAGHVAEKLEGGLWEDLINQRIFRPLKMTAGQGPTGHDQPWPHDHQGNPLPDNGPRADNAPSLGPAGRVHASLTEYTRFAADHLRGASGRPALLKPESYQALHQPDPDSHYACGWRLAERPWAGGRVLTHNGTNNANYSVVWLAPEKSFGVAAVCNRGGEAAAAACDAACSLMILEI